MKVYRLFYCFVILHGTMDKTSLESSCVRFSIQMELISIQMKESFGVYSNSSRKANIRHIVLHLFFNFPLEMNFLILALFSNFTP